jgi:hypothetical protein
VGISTSEAWYNEAIWNACGEYSVNSLSIGLAMRLCMYYVPLPHAHETTAGLIFSFTIITISAT